MTYRYIYWNHELQDAHISLCKCTETGTNFLANFQFRYQQQRTKQHQDEDEKQFVWDILWEIYSQNIHSLSFKSKNLDKKCVLEALSRQQTNYNYRHEPFPALLLNNTSKRYDPTEDMWNANDFNNIMKYHDSMRFNF